MREYEIDVEDFMTIRFTVSGRSGTLTYNGDVSIDENADYLPNVLNAFRHFLHTAGYSYVENVVAVTDGGIEHSSYDA